MLNQIRDSGPNYDASVARWNIYSGTTCFLVPWTEYFLFDPQSGEKVENKLVLLKSTYDNPYLMLITIKYGVRSSIDVDGSRYHVLRMPHLKISATYSHRCLFSITAKLNGTHGYAKILVPWFLKPCLSRQTICHPLKDWGSKKKVGGMVHVKVHTECAKIVPKSAIWPAASGSANKANSKISDSHTFEQS